MSKLGAKNMISHSVRIAWKDLMELFRNRMGLFLLILMPIFMMAMVGFIYPSETSLNNIPIALANEDNGFEGYNLSSTFILTLNVINENANMITLIDASNIDDIREMIQTGDVEGGIIISDNFSQNIINGQQGTISIVTDQSNPQV
ncbi:MAG: ABC transporter permease [Candidatus Bathyarchaeota archaeon]